jgi:antibiotic biosynthesis monooxygenase (ABM) superfamily enzyme
MENDTDRIVHGRGKEVTVVVSRRVFPGKEKEYDDWVRRLLEAASESPGSRGGTMSTSYARQKLSHEADEFSRRIRQEATGLETWFSLPECPELETPPHWKMATVTFLAVFLLSIVILKLLKWLFTDLNFYLEGFLVAAILVGLLTWIVMPFLSRHVFRRWLYK